MNSKQSDIAKIIWSKLTYTPCKINDMDTTIIEARPWEMIHELELHMNETHLREFMQWLTDETIYNIPKDEIEEIIQDWQYYKSESNV